MSLQSKVHDGRDAARVTRSIAELALDMFVATNRASAACEAARQFHLTYPSRVAALAVIEAEKEVAALAEAHGLIKRLIPREDLLRQDLPEAFAESRPATLRVVP